MKAILLYRSYDSTGEAATWLPDQEIFLWVDIDAGILHTYVPAMGLFTDCHFPGPVSTIIPWKDHPEEILLAMKDRLVACCLSDQSYRTLLVFDGMGADWRANDGKASPEGRICLGIMNGQGNHQQTGWVYGINSDLSYRKVFTHQHIPNGMVWNASGDKMYYADSGRGCIEAYDYNQQTGDVRFSRVAVEVPPAMGVPDGMTIGADGLLWVAHWGGSGVYVWDPETGKQVDKIELPVPHVASCTFGGKDRKQLFITTARSGLSEKELDAYPLSGSLFVATVDTLPGENHYPFIIT